MAADNVETQGMTRASSAARFGLVGAGLVTMALVAIPVSAQQSKQPAAKQAAPAAQAGPQSPWVKLCQMSKVAKLDAARKQVVGADGKPAVEDKSVCVTHHEQYTGEGLTLVSIGVQQLDGAPEQGLVVMVPIGPGIALPPGMRMFVYSVEQWKQVQARQKLDEKSIVQQRLQFTHCEQLGCTAEAKVDPKVIQAMQAGGMIVAMVIGAEEGKPLPLEAPLTGFAEAYKGPPVDNAAYLKQRQELERVFAARRMEHMKRIQGDMQAPPGGGAVPPAAAPAAKAAPAKK